MPRTSTRKAAASTTAAKKTTAKTTTTRTPRKRATKKTTTRLSLVKATTPPRPEPPTRTSDYISDAQIYATHTARLAGLPIHQIRAWHDHRNGTATRPRPDGSHLHYDHATRTLTWQAICPMGATHHYEITTPSTFTAARVHADRCNTPHTDLTRIPPLTRKELADLGLIHVPTWAHTLPGEPPTRSIPAPLNPKDRALTEQTQPLSSADIAEGLEARADTEAPKEHPQP